jgi:hypothetical protein
MIELHLIEKGSLELNGGTLFLEEPSDKDQCWRGNDWRVNSSMDGSMSMNTNGRENAGRYRYDRREQIMILSMRYVK